MLTALLGVLGVAFTTRRRRLPALLGVLTAAQVVLHVILSLLDASASSCGLVAVGHHVATSPCDPSVPTGSVTMAMPTLPMLAAHLAATAVTAWVLARGEAWLWRTLRGVLAVPLAVRIGATPRVWVFHRDAVRSSTRWARPDAPRGPPEPAFVAI
jgi:hypothetical protein